MEQNEIRELFQKNKALLHGHFLLSSGKHSDTYFQSALILQYADKAAKLAQAIAKKIKDSGIKVDVVISPAIGGIIIGHEVGRALGVRSVFTERVEGHVMLRRGFFIEKGERVLLVEDVITTGLSSKEVISSLSHYNAQLVGVASLVDRSGGKVDFGVPVFPLLRLDIKSYEASECPMCKEGGQAIKPGSRK